MSVSEKKIIPDCPPDIIDYDSSIVNMSIFEFNSLNTRKTKTIKAKDFELILKKLDLKDSIASKTFWFISGKYSGDDMDFYYKFIFDSKDIIEERIKTIIYRNKVSQSEIYSACKKITDEIIHDHHMMHFYYIIIGIYIIARFNETPVFVDRKKVDISNFNAKDIPLIILNNTDKDYLGIPIDSRLVNYDKDLNCLNVAAGEDKNFDDLVKTVKNCKICLPQQTQINPPITNEFYIPVPLRSVETLDENGRMTYYTAPRKNREDIPENKGKEHFTFPCFPYIYEDSEDELLENEPDSESEGGDEASDESDESDESDDAESEDEDGEDGESDEDDNEDDEAEEAEDGAVVANENANLAGGRVAEAVVDDRAEDQRFWNAVEIVAWADKSDRICHKRSYDAGVVAVIDKRIKKFVDNLKRLYNNEMTEDFYKHIILKGLDFYNEVNNDSGIAFYLLDNEVQVW